MASTITSWNSKPSYSHATWRPTSRNNPCENLSVQDIRTAIRNSTGPRPSLFVPEIASSPDSVAGKLTLDADKLADALTDNRLDVKSFLTDTTKGISAKLTGLLAPVAKASTGLIDVRANEAGSESSDIDDQIQALEDRLSQRQERLQAQFTAMEQALAQSQSQGSWLTAQLG